MGGEIEVGVNVSVFVMYGGGESRLVSAGQNVEEGEGVRLRIESEV